jgi:hypothetical protein
VNCSVQRFSQRAQGSGRKRVRAFHGIWILPVGVTPPLSVSNRCWPLTSIADTANLTVCGQIVQDRPET